MSDLADMSLSYSPIAHISHWYHRGLLNRGLSSHTLDLNHKIKMVQTQYIYRYPVQIHIAQSSVTMTKNILHVTQNIFYLKGKNPNMSVKEASYQSKGMDICMLFRYWFECSHQSKNRTHRRHYTSGWCHWKTLKENIKPSSPHAYGNNLTLIKYGHIWFIMIDSGPLLCLQKNPLPMLRGLQKLSLSWHMFSWQ